MSSKNSKMNSRIQTANSKNKSEEFINIKLKDPTFEEKKSFSNDNQVSNSSKNITKRKSQIEIDKMEDIENEEIKSFDKEKKDNSINKSIDEKSFNDSKIDLKNDFRDSKKNFNNENNVIKRISSEEKNNFDNEINLKKETSSINNQEGRNSIKNIQKDSLSRSQSLKLKKQEGENEIPINNINGANGYLNLNHNYIEESNRLTLLDGSRVNKGKFIYWLLKFKFLFYLKSFCISYFL